MTDRVRFGWEKLEVLLGEPNVREMIEDYWLEFVPTPLREFPLDIDWPRLLREEASGIYRIWGARVDGTLAGFIAFWVQPHIYYRTVLAALDGGHYLAPAFRDNHGRVGWRMWRTAKAALIKEGVRFGMVHDSGKRPLTPFFLALGAEPVSANWLWTCEED